MKYFIGIIFSGMIIFGLVSELPTSTNDESKETNFESVLHPGVPDSLFSALKFDVEVYIQKKGKNRRGAARNRSTGKPDSLLASGKAIELEVDSLEARKPVSLIIYVPSNMRNPNNPILRGVSTRFNEHFDPTYTLTKILPGNRGIEIIYHFKEGFPRDQHRHEPPIPVPFHIDGHLCEPTDPECSPDIPATDS